MGNYVIYYRGIRGAISIVLVTHGARDPRPIFEK